jgi:hypothetical protein
MVAHGVKAFLRLPKSLHDGAQALRLFAANGDFRAVEI